MNLKLLYSYTHIRRPMWWTKHLAQEPVRETTGDQQDTTSVKSFSALLEYKKWTPSCCPLCSSSSVSPWSPACRPSAWEGIIIKCRVGVFPIINYTMGDLPIIKCTMGVLPIIKYRVGVLPIINCTMGVCPIIKCTMGDLPITKYKVGVLPIIKCTDGGPPNHQMYSGGPPNH